MKNQEVLALSIPRTLTKSSYVYTCLDRIAELFPLVKTVYVDRSSPAKHTVSTWARKLGISCEIGDYVIGFLADKSDRKAVVWLPIESGHASLKAAKALAIAAKCELEILTFQSQNSH